MKLDRVVAFAIAVAMLLLPDVPGNQVPAGGANWICLAYGALAGASLMSGSLVGAMGMCLGAARAGCFG